MAALTFITLEEQIYNGFYESIFSCESLVFKVQLILAP